MSNDVQWFLDGWIKEAADKYCPNRDYFTDVSNKIECQDKCLSNPECVGIAYSTVPGNENICMTCKDERLVINFYGTGFYRRPGSYQLLNSRISSKLEMA